MQLRNPLHSGSTIDKEANSITEVNVNVASFIKFDDISNALVDVRPTRLAARLASSLDLQSQGPGFEQLAANRRKQLETSFSLPSALSAAIDKLASGSASGSAAPLASNGQQATPSLGK